MITKLLFSFFTCTLLTLTSADAQNTGGAMPPDFKCQDCILIIIKPERKGTLPGFEKAVDRQFKKYYSGKYEIATEKEAESESRFQDKKIYKFSLKYKIRGELTTNGVRNNVRFNLYDRESGTEYGSFAEAGNSGATIERTAKILGGTYK